MKAFYRNGKVLNVMNPSGVVLRPKQALLNFLKATDPVWKRWTLKNMEHYPCIHLTKGEDQNMWSSLFQSRWKDVLENELSETFQLPKKDWPTLSKGLLKQWYEIIYSETIIDLSGNPIETFAN